MEKKKKKNIFQITVRIISISSLILLFLSAFSNRISPLFCVWFSYLGLFFPFILAFNILIFALCLLFRDWRQSIVSLIVFLICSGSIYSYFPIINPSTKEIPEDCIKVLTYNVMRFEYLNPHNEKSTNSIIQYIVDSEADIICLQEFGTATKNKSKLQEKDILKAFKNTPYHYIQFLKFPYDNETFGVAIFSKFPILKKEQIPFESEFNGSILVELDVNGKKLTLINNHLESNKLSMDERTDYYDLTKDISTEKLENFTHKMFNRLNPAYKTRAKQAQMVSKYIEENENPYIVVCGDFNDTPTSYTRHKIKGNLKDAFVESGNGMGITYNMYRFFFRIDYILHSSNIKSYNCTVGKLKNSDHYPVSTYLQLK